MKNTRVVAILVGLLLLLPGLGLLVGGGGLGLVTAFGRDDSGYLTQPLFLVRSPSAAVTTDDLPVVLDPQVPAWVADMFDTSIRLRSTSADPNRPIFIGVAATADLDQYLRGVGHDVLTSTGHSPTYRTVPGASRVSPPAGQNFWVAAAQGTGTQELTWQPGNGHWSLALTNADGSPGVAAQVILGVRVGSLLPLTLVLLVAGILFTLGGVLFLRRGMKGPADRVGQAASSPTPTPLEGNGRELSSAGTSSTDRNQP